MNSAPPRWTGDELSAEAATSAQLFRAKRLADADARSSHVDPSLKKFRMLFEKLDNLGPKPIGDEALAQAYGAKLGEASRYLAGTTHLGRRPARDRRRGVDRSRCAGQGQAGGAGRHALERLEVRNLEQAQQRGLALFWSHDLERLSAFVESTR